MLTNGIEWVLYHVIFKKPIDKEEVVRLNLLRVDPRREEDLQLLYLLTRRGLTRHTLSEFRDRQDAKNRFLLAAIVVNSDSVLSAVRREVRRATGMLVEKEEVAEVLRDQVIKRDTLEGEHAEAAERRFNRRSERAIGRNGKPEAAVEMEAGDGESSTRGDADGSNPVV